ncbi:hypothetical protein [Desulfosediminicola sp.]|uniref:hypothetical protein n=1 Tax=Desulfosediminicola sp. TaxID=2886825 RepID=UPI003AF2F466
MFKSAGDTTKSLSKSSYFTGEEGKDVDAIAQKVAQLLDMDVHEVWQSGTYKRLVTARSLRSF